MHLYLRDPRRPCFPNPFDLCNKSPTRDLARFASAICNSYWSVFVRPVERISQKMDIRHLKCSESLSILNQRPSYSCAECSWECSIVEIRSLLASAPRPSIPSLALQRYRPFRTYLPRYRILYPFPSPNPSSSIVRLQPAEAPNPDQRKYCPFAVSASRKCPV